MQDASALDWLSEIESKMTPGPCKAGEDSESLWIDGPSGDAYQDFDRREDVHGIAVSRNVLQALIEVAKWSEEECRFLDAEKTIPISEKWKRVYHLHSVIREEMER